MGFQDAYSSEATTVSRIFLASDSNYKHGGGPSKNLSERNKRQIIGKGSSEGAKSLRNIKNELNLSVSKDMIRTFLKEEGYKYKKAKKIASTHILELERSLKCTKQLLEEITERKLGVENLTFAD